MKSVTIKKINIKYDENNVCILNSYQVKNKEYMELILNKFVEKTGYKSKRSIKSWLKEWKAHNRLYRLGLFRTHTRDCDLEENEKLHRLFIYQVLGI